MTYYSLAPTRRTTIWFLLAWLLWLALYWFQSEFTISGNVLISLAQNIIVLFLLSLFVYYRVTVRRKQRALNLALSNQEPPSRFFLFLRSFDTANRYRIKNYTSGYIQRMLCGWNWDIETALTFALRNEAPLIAIGEKNTTVGAIKLTVEEDDWKARFFILSEKAECIYVLPLATPSTIWEIQQLFKNKKLLEKTIFMMPPQTIFRWLLSIFFGHRKKEWEKTTSALKETGIYLPRYKSSGALFKIGQDGASYALNSPAILQDKAMKDFVREKGETVNDQISEKPRWFDRFPWRWTIFAPKFGYIAALLLLLFTCLLGYSRSFNISSTSMAPTLLVGDFLLASKWSYQVQLISDIKFFKNSPSNFSFKMGDPQRGDVAVFLKPTDETLYYIKRVIGLPGDRVQMRQGRLYLNGKIVERKHIGQRYIPTWEQHFTAYEETLPGNIKYQILELSDNSALDNTREYLVPPRHYFVVGDNRDSSTDSRIFEEVGMVPRKNFIGKAKLKIFSINSDYEWYEFWAWPVSVRWSRLYRSIE